MAVKMQSVLFWVVMPCSFMDTFNISEDHIICVLRTEVTSTRPYGIKTQNITIHDGKFWCLYNRIKRKVALGICRSDITEAVTLPEGKINSSTYST